MYTFLLTFIAVTFAYPYANYGQPAYYRTGYHQTIPNYRGPVLRQFFPGMMMGGMGGGMGGGAGGAAGGAGPMGPGGYIMQILNMFAPGIASNPMMAGMYGIDGGDWNDLIEGAMKGDWEKITNKIYDGGFDGDFMPFMMGGMGGMMGGMGAGGHSGGASGGAGGATGGTGGMYGGGMGFNPMMMGFYDMLNKPAVKPVNTRLMRARAAAEPVAEAGATGGSAPAHGGGYGGMGMGYGNFMGAMNDVFRNPMAMNAMRFTLDSSDMSDIMEAYGKGDVYEIMSKTMGKGFNPYAYARKPGAGGASGTGAESAGSAPGAGPFGGRGPFGGFFGGMGGMMNPWLMSEMFDFESPF